MGQGQAGPESSLHPTFLPPVCSGGNAHNQIQFQACEAHGARAGSAEWGALGGWGKLSFYRTGYPVLAFALGRTSPRWPQRGNPHLLPGSLEHWDLGEVLPRRPPTRRPHHSLGLSILQGQGLLRYLPGAAQGPDFLLGIAAHVWKLVPMRGMLPSVCPSVSVCLLWVVAGVSELVSAACLCVMPCPHFIDEKTDALVAQEPWQTTVRSEVVKHQQVSLQ